MRRTMQYVREALKPLGMTLKKDDAGEFVVNFKGGNEATAYYTPDLMDALGTAKAMYAAKNNPRKNPVRKPNQAQIAARARAAIKAGDFADAAKILNSVGAKQGKKAQKKVARMAVRYPNPRKKLPARKKNPILSIRRTAQGPWTRVGEIDSVQGAKLAANAFGRAGYYAKVSR